MSLVSTKLAIESECMNFKAFKDLNVEDTLYVYTLQHVYNVDVLIESDATISSRHNDGTLNIVISGYIIMSFTPDENSWIYVDKNYNRAYTTIKMNKLEKQNVKIMLS